MSASQEIDPYSEVAALRKQIAVLRSQRRSGSDFRPWKPDLFYYLFALVVSVLAAWLTGAAVIGLRTMAVAGSCFFLLCAIPAPANRLTYWMRFPRPNRKLDRKIVTLEAEIQRLQSSNEPSRR